MESEAESTASRWHFRLINIIFKRGMSLPKPRGDICLENGTIIQEEEKDGAPEFTLRESPLKVLLEQSLHIRAIYHIFVVILLVLLCDTVIYDLIERGKKKMIRNYVRKSLRATCYVSTAEDLATAIRRLENKEIIIINIGLTSVLHGFGDIWRATKLWFFELALALAFYPALRIYALVRNVIKRHPGLCKIWAVFGVLCVVALGVILVAVPVLDLANAYLALVSSAIVACEMFRFVMKITAAAVACAPRCHEGRVPLPSVSQYVYFLFAPTLIYRDEYPRTKNIRWSVVVFHFLEVTAIIIYNSFLWERFILPYWSDYGKEPKVEAGTVVRGMFACMLPGVICFVGAFYCLLHAWQNAFAEMLTFGDRLFYEDWWTTSQFSVYYRTWNRVVHTWLRDHIYRPLTPHAGRAISTILVFSVSAAAHEVVLALSFGFFYPVLMIEFGVFGLLMMPLTATSGRRFPNTFNIFMWLLLFFGNGLLWSLYSMEHFSRQNCPVSENDSFFVPKSWSCPEIVLKPNWTFQNPFDIIY